MGMTGPHTTARLATQTATAAPTDDELMKAFAAGQPQAFDALYQRHHGALYRFVRRLLGSAGRPHADDVFQDVWMRVIQSRQQWQAQGASFRTWLFTIAHHRSIDVLRRSGRESTHDFADDSPPFVPSGDPWTDWPMPADTTDPDDLTFWRAAGRRMLECLDKLPSAQRAVFLMHNEEGITLEDTAAGLDIGFETARSRLRYAMGKLRTCMGAYLPIRGRR